MCAPNVYGETKIWCFYCNRAGRFNPKGSEKRQIKSQGTNKIGMQCTAHMKATINLRSETVEVQYCATHHNHITRLSHLRIPPTVRANIAAKLQQGISMNRVLDDIRDSVEQTMNRQHLITRQDLRNVKFHFNIDGIIRHKNDLTSVSAWVDELTHMTYNPVLVFKNQGIEQSKDLDNLSDNDFILGIQTEFQLDMLKKFGATAICMDDTHGTNCYNFNLVTIVVVDDYGEGIPVGWMISNRQDTLVLMEFLKAIKERAGNVNPIWFMSDDAEQFFTAWRATFGDGSTTKLLCAWHVDRAWRKALQENIPNKEEQVEVYHQLRVLLMETEESKFRVFLQEFLTHIKKNHKKFHSYFFNIYCKRLQQWASCYRTHSVVNTNMFLEAFHRVLKIVYLHHKQNRRLDFLLTTLLKIARDKAFERFRKLETGKATHRICEINKRHKSAEGMTNHQIIIISPMTKWKVESQTSPGKHYIVEKLQDSSCQCQILCNFCGVCAHQYSCTCIDAVLYSTVCKHVHLVVLSNQDYHPSHGR